MGVTNIEKSAPAIDGASCSIVPILVPILVPFLVGVPQKANPEPGCHYEVCDRSHGPPCPLWAAVTDHRRGDDVSTGDPKQ
jgi:hypothetical protein